MNDGWQSEQQLNQFKVEFSIYLSYKSQQKAEPIQYKKELLKQLKALQNQQRSRPSKFVRKNHLSSTKITTNMYFQKCASNLDALSETKSCIQGTRGCNFQRQFRVVLNKFSQGTNYTQYLVLQKIKESMIEHGYCNLTVDEGVLNDKIQTNQTMKSVLYLLDGQKIMLMKSMKETEVREALRWIRQHEASAFYVYQGWMNLLKDIGHISFPKLMHLSLTNSRLKSLEIIGRIQIPQLEVFRLNENHIVSAQPLIKANFPNLKEFIVGKSKRYIGNNMFKELSGLSAADFPKIKYITLESCSLADPEDLRCLSKLSSSQLKEIWAHRKSIVRQPAFRETLKNKYTKLKD